MNWKFWKLSTQDPDRQKRFQLLRYFSITSLSAFLIATGLLGYFYRQRAIHDLVTLTEETNRSVTQSFSNTLWKEYSEFLLATSDLSDEALKTHPITLQLQKSVLDQMAGLPVVKVKVFDLQGRTVFSTDVDQIGDDKSTSSGFLAAQSGQSVSQLGHRDSFKALQSTISDRHLLSSYLPIRSSPIDGEIEAVFELYSDVTPLLQRINQTQRTIYMGSFLILGSLYGILFLMVQRADTILKNQHNSLETAATNYRTQSETLQQTLDQLQQTQTHLIQTEKMSSLGQLVAGVAHEINNPVSFIYGNLAPAKAYADDLLEIIELYQQAYPKPIDTIKTNLESLDYQFLKTDFPNLINSMKIGAKRIQDIVTSLRTFSRLDESDVKAADIHQGIDSTLMILTSRLKASTDFEGIEIVKDYGQLPKIDCFAGQLNQVFMNLIENAIDALEAYRKTQAPEAFKAKIEIQTELTDRHWVTIRIADNGPGILTEIQDQMLNPFFTTKPVGKGTGMGLAISYQVIEKHGGKLWYDSQIGQGTTFSLQIPVTQTSAQIEAQPQAA